MIKYNILILLFFLLFVSCENNNQKKINLDVDEKLFSFVQSRIAIYKSGNINSEILKLELISVRNDTLIYELDNLDPRLLTKKYKDYSFVYNEDSTILIFDNTAISFQNCPTFSLKNHPKYKMNDLTPLILFRPTGWRFAVTENNSFIISEINFDDMRYTDTFNLLDTSFTTN